MSARLFGSKSLPKEKNHTLLGAHVSAAGGLYRAIDIGEDLGCNTIQIFTSNNRQWSFSELKENEIAAFIERQKESKIKIVVSHASYLINIGSPTKTVALRSKKALNAELTRCEQLSIPYLVLHPGARLDSDESTCIKNIAINLQESLEKTPGKCIILLEIMAGQGSSIGGTLEQLASITDLISYKSRIGICFDTCHAFAAGYDFTTQETYDNFWLEFDKVIGIEKLKAIHLNDSLKPKSSHIDRHADIGKGEIGLEAFRLIMNDKRFIKVPKIIETPQSTIADHRRNLQTLRKLII